MPDAETGVAEKFSTFEEACDYLQMPRKSWGYVFMEFYKYLEAKKMTQAISDSFSEELDMWKVSVVKAPGSTMLVSPKFADKVRHDIARSAAERDEKDRAH